MDARRRAGIDTDPAQACVGRVRKPKADPTDPQAVVADEERSRSQHPPRILDSGHSGGNPLAALER